MHKYANMHSSFFNRLRVFKSLGCSHRIEILEILKYGAHTVSEVADFLNLHPSVVSRHLSILYNAGLLKMEKRGNEVFYSLKSPDIVFELFKLVDKIGR